MSGGKYYRAEWIDGKERGRTQAGVSNATDHYSASLHSRVEGPFAEHAAGQNLVGGEIRI